MHRPHTSFSVELAEVLQRRRFECGDSQKSGLLVTQASPELGNQRAGFLGMTAADGLCLRATSLRRRFSPRLL